VAASPELDQVTSRVSPTSQNSPPFGERTSAIGTGVMLNTALLVSASTPARFVETTRTSAWVVGSVGTVQAISP